MLAFDESAIRKFTVKKNPFQVGIAQSNLRLKNVYNRLGVGF